MENGTELVLVRHGETEWTELDRVHGILDSPLSERGLRQARLAADRLRGMEFAALFSSPLGRAMQTANILGNAIGLDPIPLEGLQEYDFGVLEGKALPRFSPDRSGPRIWRPIVRLSMALTAEKSSDFEDRVDETLEMMVNRHPGKRILVVTHWVVLSQVMRSLIDGRGDSLWSYGPWQACGITELRRVGQKWEVVQKDDAAHLDGVK